MLRSYLWVEAGARIVQRWTAWHLRGKLNYKRISVFSFPENNLLIGITCCHFDAFHSCASEGRCVLGIRANLLFGVDRNVLAVRYNKGNRPQQFAKVTNIHFYFLNITEGHFRKSETVASGITVLLSTFWSQQLSQQKGRLM